MSATPSLFQFIHHGAVCGSVEATIERDAMERWAATDLYERDVKYTGGYVVVNGVTYYCERVAGDHEGDCRFCAACQGDPEALDLHVCGREPFA